MRASPPRADSAMRVLVHPSAAAAAAMACTPRAPELGERGYRYPRAHRSASTSSHLVAMFSGHRARQHRRLSQSVQSTRTTGKGIVTHASSGRTDDGSDEASSTTCNETNGDETSDATEPSTSSTLTFDQSFRRMWTRADAYHVHAVSGGVFTVCGAGLLLVWGKQDIDFISGGMNMDPTSLTLWPLATFSLLVAGVCAISGVPLGRLRGWRKTELSARSTLFQAVLTWQALRLGPGGELFSCLDRDAWAFCVSPFAWQTLTSVYILLFTKDNKRSAALVALGAWLFGAQVFPVAAVLSASGGLEQLQQIRPELITVWVHSLFGLVWLLNWSTFGASLRARKIIDDDGYRKWFLLRPSLGWITLFALDVAAFGPFTSVMEYFTSLGGVGLIK